MIRAPFAAYQGTEPYTFVCYAHEDSEEVFSDLTWLREQGMHFWYDEGISPGANWRDESARAIEDAALFLYFISVGSVQSTHCMREWSFAADQKDLNLLAVYLRPTALPRGLRLAILDRQAILKQRLSNTEYQRVLLGTIKRIIARTPTSPSVVRSGTLPEDRIRIGIASTGVSEAETDLASGITRYLSWQGGIYRSHNLGSAASIVPTALLDYRVDVMVQDRRDQVEASCQMSRADTGEVIFAPRSVEVQPPFHTQLGRITAMIGEGVLKGISDYEKRRTSGRDASTLGYGRLVLAAEQPNYLDRELTGQRLEMLKRAIELEPNAALAHASLAALLSWQLINAVSQDAERDEATSQAEARLALKIEPNDAYVLLRVGTTYCRLGRYQRGLSLLRRSCDMAPTLQAKDQLAGGLCFAGRPAEAIPLFHEILDTMPAGHTIPYVRLAVALTQAGRLDEAAAAANDAVLHYPEDFYGWLAQANLLAQLGHEAEARAALRQAQDLIPDLKLDVAIERTETTWGRTESQRRWLTAGLRSLRDG